MHQRTHTSDTMAKNTTGAPTESASFQLAATLRGSRPGVQSASLIMTS